MYGKYVCGRGYEKSTSCKTQCISALAPLMLNNPGIRDSQVDQISPCVTPYTRFTCYDIISNDNTHTGAAIIYRLDVRKNTRDEPYRISEISDLIYRNNFFIFLIFIYSKTHFFCFLGFY